MASRSIVCTAIFLCLLGGAALAGQSSAGFSVGITIGAPGAKKIRKSPKHYTWNAAALSLSAAGYSSPVRLLMADDVYWFLAERDGRRFRVAVSKTTGTIVKVASV